MKFDSRKSTLFIRSIGGVILGLNAIDIIFFNHKYVYPTVIGNGLIAGIAAILLLYCFNIKLTTLRNLLKKDR